MAVYQPRCEFWFRHCTSHVVLVEVLLLHVLFALVIALLALPPSTLIKYSEI